MNIKLKTPSQTDLRELNEPASSPFFIAPVCLLDESGVELLIGGVTVNALFEPYSQFENAWAIMEDAYVERPDDRDSQVLEDYDVYFDTVEAKVAEYTEEELEFEAWSFLAALMAKRAQEVAVASAAGEATEYPTRGLEALVEHPQSFTEGCVTYLEPVGLLSKEEVAARFSVDTSGGNVA